MARHHMRLTAENFELIKNGTKRTELRVNDKKRQLLKVGDQIEFQNMRDPAELLTVEITRLTYYPDFGAMYTDLQDQYPDYTEETFIAGMRQYYSSEVEQEFGAVAIWVKRTSDYQG